VAEGLKRFPRGRSGAPRSCLYNPFAAETVWCGKTLYPSHDKGKHGGTPVNNFAFFVLRSDTRLLRLVS